ncbi:hypothetical protein [Fischerella sp. FACHB-380]|uniref:hypothetical protein n=1 Tax=Fischerella sp. FACHB-380 TaxID=2692799 RepID=UPI001684C277|nr:hypothetical protein [Fischerella sp. FACHB-380]MBD2429827.1 hypothetical protein [Fischerella sp. FACHB-380]
MKNRPPINSWGDGELTGPHDRQGGASAVDGFPGIKHLALRIRGNGEMGARGPHFVGWGGNGELTGPHSPKGVGIRGNGERIAPYHSITPLPKLLRLTATWHELDSGLGTGLQNPIAAATA